MILGKCMMPSHGGHDELSVLQLYDAEATCVTHVLINMWCCMCLK